MSAQNLQDVILPYGVTQEPILAPNGGYERLTVTDAAVTSLNPPAYAVACSIVYEDSANTSNVVARFCFNDVPTATNGNPLTHLMYMELYGVSAMSNFNVKAYTGLSGKINVQYYR